MIPCQDWLTDDLWQCLWEGFGPHSPQEPHETFYKRFGNPDQIDSPEIIKWWIDGYDTAIRYVDTHVGRLLNLLAEKGVLEDTMIIISADHGENQGELKIWGDHQTAAPSGSGDTALVI